MAGSESIRSESVGDRLVEVIGDAGPEAVPRYRHGSGLIVGPGWILTAAHVLTDAVSVIIRRADKTAARVPAAGARVGNIAEFDVAVLPAAGVGAGLGWCRVGRLDRGPSAALTGCWSAGYPQYKQTTTVRDGMPLREREQVSGTIPPYSDAVAGLLCLNTDKAPQAFPAPGESWSGSPWSGMSGAPVFTADDVLLAVVTEHAPRRGVGELMATPIDRLATAVPDKEQAHWYKALGVENSTHLLMVSGAAGAGAPVTPVRAGQIVVGDIPREPPAWQSRVGPASEIDHALGQRWPWCARWQGPAGRARPSSRR